MNALGALAKQHALSQKRIERLADVGKAENQPVSIEVLKTAEAMSAVITEAYAMQELEEQIARLQHRLENQARTIRVQSETIARLEEEVHAFASRSAKEIAAVVREDIVRSLQDEVVALREAIARLEGQIDGLSLEDCIDLAYSKYKEGVPPQAPTIPKEPPLAQETANVPDTQKYAGDWRNFRGWKVPASRDCYVRWKDAGDVELLYWRLSVESGWVEAEKWGEPVGVHPVPNVTIAEGK